LVFKKKKKKNRTDLKYARSTSYLSQLLTESVRRPSNPRCGSIKYWFSQILQIIFCHWSNSVNKKRPLSLLGGPHQQWTAICDGYSEECIQVLNFWVVRLKLQHFSICGALYCTVIILVKTSH